MLEYYASSEGRRDDHHRRGVAGTSRVGRTRPYEGATIYVLDPVTREEMPPARRASCSSAPRRAPEFVYHNDPSKTTETHHGDLFTAGDIGYLDEDGYLFLTDRQSNMIISGGVNLYPREIEDAIESHPGVADVAVFGIPDDDLGERPRTR